MSKTLDNLNQNYLKMSVLGISVYFQPKKEVRPVQSDEIEEIIVSFSFFVTHCPRNLMFYRQTVIN